MKTLLNFLSEPVAVALGWTLLHALWQGFALVLPAALCMYLLRRKSSQLRYNIGVGTLLAQVALSVATFSWYYQPVLHTIRSSAKTMITTAVSAPAIWPIVSRSLPWHVQAQRFLETHLVEIVVCWLIGVAVFLVRLAGGWLYVQRLKTTAVQPADAVWQSMQTRLSNRLGIQQSVRVLESMQVMVPMVVGALKPVILLPIGLVTGLSMQEAEAVLAHELAHIKRFDYAVNLLQSVVEVVYFFHPALWWLSARVREERENCCDDLAVLACGDARHLAKALARVEEFSRTPALAMALASRKKLLLNRVRRMLGVSARPVVSNGHLFVLTLATVLLATVSVYAIQQQTPQPKPRKAASLPTRRHTAPNGTEFGITDNRKVDYVVWKGQKLPAKQVARLQSQLDKVMAGQLSLDDVAQPDRDILLAIIETNNSFKGGMNGLAEGLSQIDADNMTVASSLNDLSGNLAELQNLNYARIADEAMATADKAQIDYSKLINEALTTAGRTNPDLNVFLHQSKGNADSLQAIREQNRSKAAALRLQMEKQRFAMDAIRRKMEIVSYDKMRLEQQRLKETMRQRQILMKNRAAQSDSDRDISAKEIADSEQAIQNQEAAIEKNSQQLMELQNQLDEAQKPIREAETQLRKLGVMNRQMYSVDAVGAADFEMPEMPEIPEVPEIEMPEIPEAPEINSNGSINRAGRTPGSARRVTAPRAIAPAPRPAVAPTPKAVNGRAVTPARPAKAPKPAVVPARDAINNAGLLKSSLQLLPAKMLGLDKC